MGIRSHCHMDSGFPPHQRFPTQHQSPEWDISPVYPKLFQTSPEDRNRKVPYWTADDE